jgi:SAM-dependent methyltransferase
MEPHVQTPERKSSPTASSGAALAALRARLPPAFDVAVYRSLYADLERFPDEELQRHYLVYGQNEGRRAHSLESREAFASLLSPDLDVLEIGPFAEPMVTGPRTRYFELLDKAGITAVTAARGRDTSHVPDVHYVSPTADLSIVTRTFDAVITSHVIEHQPDLLAHLDSIRRLLRRGGVYFILMPDKRYCFDHFMPDSNIADVMDAYVSRRTRHTLKSHVNYAAMRAHNDSRRHWRGDHGSPSPTAISIEQAVVEHEKSEASGQYSDTHGWYFQPETFAQCLTLLRELGKTDFELVRLYPTLLNRDEFWVVLGAPR